MTPDRWQRITEIYEVALEQAPADRSGFLDSACGDDPDLRSEVESLLAHADASVVIDGPVWRMAGAVLDPEPLLGPGQHVGAYQILTAIGAGGMGVVYRARDARLERDVALKVLPTVFSDDPDRLARFRREAHVLASLNHPNIAAIHGFEDAGDVHALVLELVNGPTLADRLKRGPLPVRESLSIAKQVADALIAAHELGIVHRDLKPANVKLRDDGTVKLLDFGLAKPLEPAQQHASPTAEPVTGRFDSGAAETIALGTPDLTSAGMLLGTVAYISPEQFAGRPADKRSDVWAFGCVLYEMLAGRPAFDGADVAATRRAVLESEPDWRELPRTVPRSVRTLLDRCLQKDRRLRTADMSAVAYVLLDVDDEHGTGDAGVAAGRRRFQVLSAAALGFIAAAFGASTSLLLRGGTDSPAPVTWLVAPLERLAVDPGRSIDISPDGSLMVYDSRPNDENSPTLMIRPLDRLGATPVQNTRGANSPFFSPDGRSIGFAAQSEIRTVPVDGGPLTVVCQIVGIPPRGFSWGADGRIYFATSDEKTGLLSVPAAGGEPDVVTTPDAAQGERDHWHPHALPNGRAVLFTIVGQGASGDRIGLFDLSTQQRRSLDIQGSQAVYVASGHIVYAADRSWRAVPFDAERLEVLGSSFAVDIPVAVTREALADFGVSSNGTLVYSADIRWPQRQLVMVDAAGREEPVPGAPLRAYISLQLSPNRQRIALDTREDADEIWLFDRVRRTFEPLNRERGGKRRPVWLDDDTIVFQSDRDGNSNLYVQRANGDTPAVRLTSSEWAHSPYSVSQNPLRVFFTELGIPIRADVGILEADDLRTGHRPRTRMLLATTETESNPVLSPNGRWLAHWWNPGSGPPYRIYVRPYPDVNALRIPVAAGTHPAWTPDGRQLLFMDQEGYLTAVDMPIRDGRPEPETPVRLLDAPYFAGGPLVSGRPYEVLPDGRMLMIKEISPGAGNAVVVQNWTEELKRLARGD